MKHLVLVAATALGVFVFVAIGLALVTKSPIPASIQKQANFTLFYFQNAKTVRVNAGTYKYSAADKQFSFIAQYQGRKITFAEQVTPDQFNDIPNYQDAFLDKMRSYTTFGNTLGQIALTEPAEVKHQVAVMNSKGTLLFAQTNSDMSEDQWRGLFNQLKFAQSQ